MDDIVANKPVGIKDFRDLMDFRKVTYFTFLLNQMIAPFSPVSFRVVNILIHVLNTALVYFLAYKTVLLYRGIGQRPGNSERERDYASGGFTDQAFAVALISGAIFALHPININAVAYIAQRMASLAALFVLLALLSYIRASLAASRFTSVVFYSLSCLSLALGIFSKENAVLAVPLIILYDFFFISRSNRPLFMKKLFLMACIGLVVIGLASYFLRFHVRFLEIGRLLLDSNKPLAEAGWTAVDVYWSPLQHILTEFRVISRYLLILFVPLPQFLVFDWWGFPVSSGIIVPLTTLFSLLLLVGLLTFSLWGVKRLPFISFGILWYLIAISLESFLAIGSDLYFEHRNYLPVAGLLIGIIGQVLLSMKSRIHGRGTWAVAIILSIILGGLTIKRNMVWEDAVTLWDDTLKKSPSNVRAMVALGNAYMKLSDLDDAAKYYEEAATVSYRDRNVHFFNDSAYSLGMLYLFRGDLKHARAVIERLTKNVETNRTQILAGFYKALNDDTEGALRDYREVVGKTKGIDKVVVYTLMGDAYRMRGQWDEAIKSYQKALSVDPSFSAAYYGAGASYMGKRDLSQAEEYFHKALFLDPYNVLALSDMADLLLIKKANPGEALNLAEKAVAKSPPFYQPYLTMGNVLIVLGREREADDFYKKAEERGLEDYMVPFSKARAYYLKGDREKVQQYLSELRRYKLPEKMQALMNRQ